MLKSFNPDIEYIPNNTYPYYKVRKTLAQSARVQVKPCRFWNELPVKDISDGIFYSLCEFWPSMPKDVDIINENSLLGLPLYRINEQNRTNQARLGAKVHMVNDNSYTIEFLLSTGAIASDTQKSFEEYLTAINEVEMKYSKYIINWPFLASQRLLRLQMNRLKTIKLTLIERIDKYPLSSANSAGVNNPDPNAGNNPSDMVMEEGEAASAEDHDLMLFQRGETDVDTTQSEIRPDQADPGGWEF
jgi:hypothetical protein